MQRILRTALTDNQLVLTAHQCEQLLMYLQLLTKWNRVFNLTQITDAREMVYLHLIDSLVVHPVLHGTHLLDVGSGAGLPGLPLAILNPQQQWTLLDKNGKKTRFLRQVVAELNLPNVTIVHSRCEDFHPSACFDSILSRALGSLASFVELTRHLLCKQGSWIALKGQYKDQEIRQIPSELQVDVLPIEIKGMDVTRHMIRMRIKEDAA